MQQANHRITLYISGNPRRSEGFQPIVAIGNVLLHPSYKDNPGMKEAPYYYVLRTTRDNVQCTLVQNHITTVDGVEGATLKFTVAIPSGWQLADGGPTALLQEVRQAFITHYMRPTLGVEGGYTYKDVRPDKAVFEGILAHHRLVAAPYAVTPMQGKEPGLLIATENEAAEIVAQPTHTQLAAYSKVIIASQADRRYYEGRVIQRLTRPAAQTYATATDGQTRPTIQDAGATSAFVKVVYQHKRLIVASLAALIMVLAGANTFVGYQLWKHGSSQTEEATDKDKGAEEPTGYAVLDRRFDFDILLREGLKRLNDDRLTFAEAEDLHDKMERYKADFTAAIDSVKKSSHTDEAERGRLLTDCETLVKKDSIYHLLTDIIASRKDEPEKSLRRLKAIVEESAGAKMRRYIKDAHCEKMLSLFTGTEKKEWNTRSEIYKTHVTECYAKEDLRSFVDFDKVVEDAIRADEDARKDASKASDAPGSIDTDDDGMGDGSTPDDDGGKEGSKAKEIIKRLGFPK